MTRYVAVIGPEKATDGELAAARDLGRELAQAGAVIVCGGLGGVMEAACRGAAEVGGLTVGLLPGSDRTAGNRHLAVAIATGLGELRNGLIVRSSDAVIAIGGADRSHGTLSEIALALKAGKPVIGLGSWPIKGVRTAVSPREAMRQLAGA